MSQSIYDKLDGEFMIDRIANIWYDLVLKDSTISSFYEGLDMNYQRNSMKKYLQMMFGGGNVYEGKSMKEAHSKYTINSEHFKRQMDLLIETLRELHIEKQLLNQMTDIINSTKNEIVNSSDKEMSSKATTETSKNEAKGEFNRTSEKGMEGKKSSTSGEAMNMI